MGMVKGEMAHTITLIENDTVILLKVTQPTDERMILDYAREVHKYIDQTGIHSVLCDLTESINKGRIFELHNFAYEGVKSLPEERLKIRVAILVAPDDHSRDFLETVLQNSGHHVKIFTDREQALRWVKGWK